MHRPTQKNCSEGTDLGCGEAVWMGPAEENHDKVADWVGGANLRAN